MNARTRYILIAFVPALFLTATLSAQQEIKTIVLKDGNVVIGWILSQTDDTLRVCTDSDTLTIASSTIRRIQNKIARTQAQDTSSARTVAPPNTIEDSFRVWEIIGGVAVPTGAFAATDLSRIGFASTGVCLGGLYRIDLEKGFEVGFKEIFDYYPFNRDGFARLLIPGTQIDVGSWYMFWTLGSVGLHVPMAPDSRMHAAALIGYVFGISPKISASNGSAHFSFTSAGSQAFAYGGEIGYYIKGVDIELRYLATSLEFKFGTGSGGSFSIRQPAATVQICIGVNVD